jgi:orotate phosphoribosyltransferase
VADILVRTGAISFQTDPFFRFTSGVESPVYVDNRRLLGFVRERREIARELGGLATEVCGQRVDAVAGTATAGIPWAAWLAEVLELPMMYVRSEAKAWGHRRAVEGFAPAGAQTLLVEDLAFSGGSIVAAVENLRAAEYRVANCLTIATYQMPSAARRFAEMDVCHSSLTTIDAALAVAAEMGTLGPQETEVVHGWLVARRDGEAEQSHVGSEASGGD